MKLIGEIAGLATSFFFAMTAIIFTKTGRMVGSQVTNRMRLLFALTYLVVINLILFREPLPFSAGSSRWIWLSLSGVIGLSLGDAFLFQAFVSIGPRLGTLLLSLAPIFGSIIAWVFFGETLTPLQITGIVLALAGIGWVVMSHEEPADTPHGQTRRGVIFGVLAGLGQAVGLGPLQTGNDGRFFSFSGKCHPYACRDNFHLDLGGLSKAGKGDNFSCPQTTASSEPACARRFGRTCAGRIRIPAGGATC